MGARVEWHCGYDQLAARHGLTDLAAVFAWQDGDRLDKATLESWRQRWRIRLSDVGPSAVPGVLFLKRFDHPPLRHQFERWRQGHWLASTGGTEWGNARALAAAGVSAATAVGYGQLMAGPWERRSFVVLAEVRGDSLERWLPRHLAPAAFETDHQRRRTLSDQLACFVARFHRAGFVHRDLYLCHIFFDAQAEAEPGGDGRPRFTLIDLQRVFRPKWRFRRWVIKDLAALSFSVPSDRVGPFERLRFLCRYARACPRFGTARELAGPVAAKVARMARRHPAPLAGEWSRGGVT
ncbi:MAG: hypothetical protein KA354_10850 [Phycisphaerae bacterium]|nr:hypothetical protein [Phycisphaerae bacterium]